MGGCQPGVNDRPKIMEGRFTYGCWASLVFTRSRRIMIVTSVSVPVSVPETSLLAALSAGGRAAIFPVKFICSTVEVAGRPAGTSRSVLLLRGWLCGVARDGQVEQDHGVVVGGAGLG